MTSIGQPGQVDQADTEQVIVGVDTHNGGTRAKRAGEMSPDGMQRLLRWADWDVDAVRDDVLDYVVDTSATRARW